MSTKSQAQKLDQIGNKMPQDSQIFDIFDEFNNLQKEIFKTIFSSSLKRPEAKSELINPKSPKTPKLVHQEAQVVKKSAKKAVNQDSKAVKSPKVPQNKSNQLQNVAIQAQNETLPQSAAKQPQKIANQLQNVAKPKTAKNQPKTASNQQQNQNISQEKFEFKKIQPQELIQPDVGTKILNKVLQVQQTIPIQNLIIQNQFLYPEISIITAGSSKNTQPLGNPIPATISVNNKAVQVPKDTKKSPQIPKRAFKSKNVAQQSPKVVQAPQAQLIVPNNLLSMAEFHNGPFMTLYNSKTTQSTKMESPVIQKVDQEVFKIPEALKPAKRVIKLPAKLKERRKSDPEPPKHQKAATAPKRSSLGQKKSPIATDKDARHQQLMKKLIADAKVNVYETPRRSFLVPQGKNDSKNGLRRGRSKFRNELPGSRPQEPEKNFEEMSQEEFFGVLGLMRN
ncbi:unnamed protein product [Chironomus riparius]|uniref:Uncharacterized protein n=1 Tax=Chironomus riparius TaxID=315576 RepID=A0A9N9S7P2_9DIPT|nr:unnamed protein product [Chironomus riparius]